jgi:cardiolipin synthase
VKIRIITPGEHMDAETVRRASRAGWGDLLRAGVAIHEFQPTMFHCKVLVVDGLWVSVGSTNFDTRSFDLNDEANLNIVDADFARRQLGIFESDLARSNTSRSSNGNRVRCPRSSSSTRRRCCARNFSLFGPTALRAGSLN